MGKTNALLSEAKDVFPEISLVASMFEVKELEVGILHPHICRGPYLFQIQLKPQNIQLDESKVES